MRYKVGDIVRVRDDLDINKEYAMDDGEDGSLCVVQGMVALHGQIAVIRKSYRSGENWHCGYIIELLDGEPVDCGLWTDDMFDGFYKGEQEMDTPDAEELNLLYDWA